MIFFVLEDECKKTTGMLDLLYKISHLLIEFLWVSSLSNTSLCGLTKQLNCQWYLPIDYKKMIPL